MNSLEKNSKNTKSIKSDEKFGDDIWQEIQGLIYSRWTTNKIL